MCHVLLLGFTTRSLILFEVLFSDVLTIIVFKASHDDKRGYLIRLLN